MHRRGNSARLKLAPFSNAERHVDITPKPNLVIRTLAAVVDGLLVLWLWVFVAPALVALALVVAVFTATEKLVTGSRPSSETVPTLPA